MVLYLQPDKAALQRGIAKLKLGISDAGSRLPARLQICNDAEADQGPSYLRSNWMVAERKVSLMDK